LAISRGACITFWLRGKVSLQEQRRLWDQQRTRRPECPGRSRTAVERRAPCAFRYPAELSMRFSRRRAGPKPTSLERANGGGLHNSTNIKCRQLAIRKTGRERFAGDCLLLVFVFHPWRGCERSLTGEMGSEHPYALSLCVNISLCLSLSLSLSECNALSLCVSGQGRARETGEQDKSMDYVL
jgi:hypothetical protein